MAWYKDTKFLSHNTHANFDTIWNPGAKPPDSGIYRCPGCGHEITHVAGDALPPQNHHQHNSNQGNVRWQMIVTHAR